MATKKRLADCKTEAEQAQWFEDNQDLLLKKFKQAAAKGKLIPVEQVVDLSAKRPASKKEMLLHEGLDREETMAGAAPAPRRRAR